MITACIGGDACQFLGLVDPGGTAVGPLYLDSAYFTACTPGACGAPVPFLATPAFLAGTSIAAVGGLSAAAVAGIAAAAILPAAVAVGVTTSSGDPDPVQTGSQ